MSTAAQDNEKIKLDGGNQDEFNKLLNRANKVNYTKTYFLNKSQLFNVNSFQIPDPSAGNIDSRDSGLSTLEAETESFEKIKV